MAYTDQKSLDARCSEFISKRKMCFKDEFQDKRQCAHDIRLTNKNILVAPISSPAHTKDDFNNILSQSMRMTPLSHILGHVKQEPNSSKCSTEANKGIAITGECSRSAVGNDRQCPSVEPSRAWYTLPVIKKELVLPTKVEGAVEDTKRKYVVKQEPADQFSVVQQKYVDYGSECLASKFSAVPASLMEMKPSVSQALLSYSKQETKPSLCGDKNKRNPSKCQSAAGQDEKSSLRQSCQASKKKWCAATKVGPVKSKIHTGVSSATQNFSTTEHKSRKRKRSRRKKRLQNKVRENSCLSKEMVMEQGGASGPNRNNTGNTVPVGRDPLGPGGWNNEPLQHTVPYNSNLQNTTSIIRTAVSVSVNQCQNAWPVLMAQPQGQFKNPQLSHFGNPPPRPSVNTPPSHVDKPPPNHFGHPAAQFLHPQYHTRRRGENVGNPVYQTWKKTPRYFQVHSRNAYNVVPKFQNSSRKERAHQLASKHRNTTKNTVKEKDAAPSTKPTAPAHQSGHSGGSNNRVVISTSSSDMQVTISTKKPTSSNKMNIAISNQHCNSTTGKEEKKHVSATPSIQSGNVPTGQLMCSWYNSDAIPSTPIKVKKGSTACSAEATKGPVVSGECSSSSTRNDIKQNISAEDTMVKVKCSERSTDTSSVIPLSSAEGKTSTYVLLDIKKEVEVLDVSSENCGTIDVQATGGSAPIMDSSVLGGEMKFSSYENLRIVPSFLAKTYIEHKIKEELISTQTYCVKTSDGDTLGSTCAAGMPIKGSDVQMCTEEHNTNESQRMAESTKTLKEVKTVTNIEQSITKEPTSPWITCIKTFDGHTLDSATVAEMPVKSDAVQGFKKGNHANELHWKSESARTGTKDSAAIAGKPASRDSTDKQRCDSENDVTELQRMTQIQIFENEEQDEDCQILCILNFIRDIAKN